MNDLICMAWQVTYQGGEGHKVLWGLWKFWRQEGVTGVRSRGEGSGLAGVRPVAAKEVALAPRTHTHQRFSCLQVCVLQARRSTRERLFAVMPSSLRVGPTMTHVHSLSGTMNKHQTKKASVLPHHWVIVGIFNCMTHLWFNSFLIIAQMNTNGSLLGKKRLPVMMCCHCSSV